MSLHTGYLSDRQFSIWRMLRNGLSQSDIARKLSVSRQAVNKLTGMIPERVGSALNDAARLNRVSPTYLDVSKGLLYGWSEDLQSEVVIAMGQKGLQVWYQHNLGECKICLEKRQCKSTLLKNANELGVSLSHEERKLNPSELSDLIFSRVSGRRNK